MEIKIETKRNNPLTHRTEVHFSIDHQGEPTPNKDLIRNELADKLNTKKENIIINNITSGFGTQKTMGYAKVYSSLKKIKDVERNYLLKRNKLISDKKEKDSEKAEEKPKETKEEKTEEKPAEEKPQEPVEKEIEEKTSDETKEEKPEEDKKETDAKTDDKVENTEEKDKEEEKKE